ncbi:MAG TPA: hypothetical protein VN681_04955 [Stellaceae bacterium]|nr:hypothetical protein [Stellaceae bacterium]
MTRHRYPMKALAADYARAVLGLALCLPPLLLAATAPVAAAIFGVLALLFALFALSTLLRQLGTIVLDEQGIAVDGGWSRRMAWASLARVNLRWFAARRDRRSGTMQLVLRGGGRRIAIDSRIADFTAIAAAAAAAAEARGLTLSEVTRDNLAALGVESSAVSHRASATTAP